ncbi:hypothetical protein HNV08_08960 [Winogradskyella eckloniae]|uniref:hypothetical protein n=1 Tax=Winogradskyella eckloniae TaxID=1089306 RepID=UPI001563C819|nr:hypothetical protein [Winogradskyella eckloniae]NRD20178.1 hypothetical protein [Winogradskyella eckloniae]
MRITIILIIMTIQIGCKNRNETNIKSENSAMTEFTKCNYNNEAIANYHTLTNKAEMAICAGDFEKASKNYALAFKEIKKPFGADVYNAALSNQLSNNLDERNLNLQLLINNSDDLSSIKPIFVNTYIDENLWNSFIEKRTTDYDSSLRSEFKSIYERDQMFRPMYDTHNDTIQANRLLNMNRILSLTDSLGFPSQIELGFRRSLRGQNHDVVLVHTSQRRSSNKNIIDLEPIFCKAVNEGRFDPEQAISYLNFQNDKDKGNFEVYSTWQYRHHLLPDSLNNQIWLPNLNQEKYESANETRKKWNADQLDEIAIKSDFISRSYIPFIFTSVKVFVENMSINLTLEEALKQYKMSTSDKRPFEKSKIR